MTTSDDANNNVSRRLDAIDFDLIVGTFSMLEDDLIDCTRYVPYIENNRNTVSPKFAAIITESCNLVDSLLRAMCKAEGDSRRLTFRDYSRLLEDTLDLDENSSLLLCAPIEFLKPFQDWRETQPDWWRAYNALKHDRLGSISSAVFRNCVSALCALHQVIARCPLFTKSLLKSGWINTADGDVAANVGLYLRAGPPLACSVPRAAVESRLFLSCTAGNVFEEGDESDSPDPDYQIPGITERARNFMMLAEET